MLLKFVFLYNFLMDGRVALRSPCKDGGNWRYQILMTVPLCAVGSIVTGNVLKLGIGFGIKTRQNIDLAPIAGATIR